MTIEHDVPLADQTSWLVGGRAEFFCRPRNPDEVEEALRWALDRGCPWTVLSGGSNVLISDDGIEGLVISLRQFTNIETREENGRFVLNTWAGTGKSELLKVFLKQKLAPALFLAGLPGDVGGGIAMNAGVAEAMVPREFHEIVDSFEVLLVEQGKPVRRTFQHDDVQWSYRHSAGWQPGIVLSARLSWPMQPEDDILVRVREANRVRLSKQPLDLPSCGSVFVNPPNEKAARLIDTSGLKGYSVGGAQVSLKHANFIVNTGQATARDVSAVIEHVKATVLSKTGVELKTEVVRLGRPMGPTR